MLRPVKKKGWSNAARTGVVAGAVAVLTLGGVAIKKNIDFNRQVAQVKVELVQSKMPVRDVGLWSKIATIYGWHPSAIGASQKIAFIEQVSKRAGVSPANVLLTLELNGLGKRTAWVNRLATLKKNPIANKNTIAQAERVLKVYDALFENTGLAKQIETDVYKTRGSLRKIKPLAE